MGRELFDRFPELTARASEILGYSIRKLCLENPNGLVDETFYTQPATFFVNALHLLARQEDGDEPPAAAIGHSLGEYNALHAAGVFDLETGLRLVRARSAAMARVRGGAMAAVVGLDRARVAEILGEHGLTSLDIANDNAPTQVVLSGPREAIDTAAAVYGAQPGTRCTVLRTSGAFHSRYMAGAARQFAAYLDAADVVFAAPRIPVVANLDARPYERARVADTLVGQITAPVRWVDSLRELVAMGASDFREVGTGRVLTSLLDLNLARTAA